MLSFFKFENNKIIYKNKLIFFLKELHFNQKLTLIDIGARFGLNKPFSYIGEKYLNIIGFEPDKDEYENLNKNFKNRTYFNSAIYSKKKISNFYLLKDKPASSLYKPNQKLGKKFEKQHFEKRYIDQVYRMKTQTLNFYKNKIPKLDFLKIDTQGSEFDILQGSSFFLKSHCPIILTETWSDDVYENAKKFYDISKFLDSYNYNAIKIDDAANWKYRTNINFSNLDQPIRVGYEILFVKKPEILLKQNFKDLLKSAILLDLFGYKNFAYYLIKNHPKPNESIQKKYLDKIRYLDCGDRIISSPPCRLMTKILIKFKILDQINYPLHT